jgi:hypothetical protein
MRILFHWLKLTKKNTSLSDFRQDFGLQQNCVFCDHTALTDQLWNTLLFCLEGEESFCHYLQKSLS